MSEFSVLLQHYQLTADICSEEISDVHLEQISHSHCEDWRRLPPHLELETIMASDIDRKQVAEDEKRQEFFFAWKKTNGSGATYKNLIEALLKIGCKQDAESICMLLQVSTSDQTHSTSSTPTSRVPTSSAPITRSGIKSADMLTENRHAAEAASVVLIGSIGHGKSSLGNFLLDPDGNNEYFRVGRANTPPTQTTQWKEVAVTYFESNHKYTDCRGAPETLNLEKSAQPVCTKLTVIDATGVTEISPGAYLQHTIDFVEKLKERASINACIFVARYNSYIDEQYTNTIEYYAKLQPSLFHHNPIIVMTNFAMDDRSIYVRSEDNVKQIISNVKTHITKIAKLPSEPIVICIDSHPFRSSDQEVTAAKAARDAIILRGHPSPLRTY